MTSEARVEDKGPERDGSKEEAKPYTETPFAELCP